MTKQIIMVGKIAGSVHSYFYIRGVDRYAKLVNYKQIQEDGDEYLLVNVDDAHDELQNLIDAGETMRVDEMTMHTLLSQCMMLNVEEIHFY